MDSIVLMALLATLGTWLVTALGAATVVFFKTPNPKALNLMLGFASGVMIAASFWSLLQPAIERAEERLAVSAGFVVTVGFLCGALFIWISDKAVTFMRRKVDNGGGSPNKKFSRIMMLILSITIHNIPEGLAVGLAFGAAAVSGEPSAYYAALGLAIGMSIQNFPEGAIISMPLRAGGVSKRKAFMYGVLSGIVEPIGAAITLLAVSAILPILPFLLGFAAGAMIYAVVKELMPSISEDQNSEIGPLSFCAGFSLMMILDVALG